MKKCQKQVEDHRSYDVMYETASEWLAAARTKYSSSESLSNCLEDLQTGQTIVQVKTSVFLFAYFK